MFKHQSSHRSVHPYQTTVVPRTELQLSSASQQRTKYPWAEDVNTPMFQTFGTDSSTSDSAYHVPQMYNNDRSSQSPVYHAPYSHGTWKSYRKSEASRLSPQMMTFPQCASAFSLPLCEEPVHQSGHSPVRPITPDIPTIGACGGHCPGFEYVCYYVLQVLFVVGILTGISLCIAGMVLRRTNRNGDLGVLVYIGCLSACVCGLLLGVQSCARRDARRRKLGANTHIPLQPLQEVPANACPLLSSTLPRSHIYRPSAPSVCPDEDVSRVPWWRRATD